MADAESTPDDPRFKDLTGNRYGRLTVVSYAGKLKPRVAIWNCICDCGAETTVRKTNLISGCTKSCGCLAIETTAAKNASHGHTMGRMRTPEYRTWVMMNDRCHNPNSSGYHKYGEKGVHVCEAWRQDFMVFFGDMGIKPSPVHSIDRINNSRGYEPGNCRWATPSEQARNRRTAHFLTINGVKMHLKDAAALSPVAESAVLRRLRRGWSDEDAVFAPAMSGVERPHLVSRP